MRPAAVKHVQKNWKMIQVWYSFKKKWTTGIWIEIDIVLLYIIFGNEQQLTKCYAMCIFICVL